MNALDQFPNLRSPLWDAIRIPVRGPIKRIAEELCNQAGLDPDLVRTYRHNGSAPLPDGFLALRQRIMVEIVNAGFTVTDAQWQWFSGFKATTLQDYLYDGRKLQREGEDA